MGIMTWLWFSLSKESIVVEKLLLFSYYWGFKWPDWAFSEFKYSAGANYLSSICLMSSWIVKGFLFGTIWWFSGTDGFVMTSNKGDLHLSSRLRCPHEVHGLEVMLQESWTPWWFVLLLRSPFLIFLELLILVSFVIVKLYSIKGEVLFRFSGWLGVFFYL